MVKKNSVCTVSVSTKSLKTIWYSHSNCHTVIENQKQHYGSNLS